MVKVKAIRALSCSAASNASAPGCSPRSGSRISVQPTPATFGRPHASSTTARAMEIASRVMRHHTLLCRHHGRAATSSCTSPDCHGPAGRGGLDLRDTSGAHPTPGPTVARRFLSVRASTVIFVPPSTTTAPATATGDGGPSGTGAAVKDQPPAPKWLRRLFGYCWRHPRITLLAGLSAVGGVGLGALTPLLTQIAVDDATAGN